MKKMLMVTTAIFAMTGFAVADEVKIGLILGFTGPLESITPDMGHGAELAMSEVSVSGKFMGGATVTSVRGDCSS
jgi:branched-chain amino acid transport system substrate-binding protein